MQASLTCGWRAGAVGSERRHDQTASRANKTKRKIGHSVSAAHTASTSLGSPPWAAGLTEEHQTNQRAQIARSKQHQGGLPDLP